MREALETLLQNPRIWRARQCAHPPDAQTLPSGYPALDHHLPGGGWPRQALTEILIERHGRGELQLLMPALARLSRGGGGSSAQLCRASLRGRDAPPRQSRKRLIAREQGRRCALPLRLCTSAGCTCADLPEESAGAEEGWIAWIAPPFQPYPPALTQWGVELSRVLVVHPKKNADVLWAAEQALASGNCAAVLSWPPVMSDAAGRRLQLAAEKGRSWAIVFRESKARSEISAAALRLEVAGDERGTDVVILKSRGGRPVRVQNVFHERG